MAAEWGEAMDDVEFETLGPDVTPPLDGHAPHFAPAATLYGKRGRTEYGVDGGAQHGLGPLDNSSDACGDENEIMHARIKRLDIGRDMAPPGLVWHGDTSLAELARQQQPQPEHTHTAHAHSSPIPRKPSFDAQSERERLDLTYTCVNQLLGRLHEERQARRRRNGDESEHADTDDDL
jgi:hypothetical protein